MRWGKRACCLKSQVRDFANETVNISSTHSTPMHRQSAERVPFASLVEPLEL